MASATCHTLETEVQDLDKLRRRPLVTKSYFQQLGQRRPNLRRKSLTNILANAALILCGLGELANTLCMKSSRRWRQNVRTLSVLIQIRQITLLRYEQLGCILRRHANLTWGGSGQGGRIRVTSADLQYLFGIQGLSPIA